MPPPFWTTDTQRAQALPPPRCPSSELADLRVTSSSAEATVSPPLIGREGGGAVGCRRAVEMFDLATTGLLATSWIGRGMHVPRIWPGRSSRLGAWTPQAPWPAE